MADYARGERFRALREQRHLSQFDLAHELKVSDKTVRAWEQDGGIKWRNAEVAAQFFKVAPESLVRHEGDPAQLDRIEALLTALAEHAGLSVEAILADAELRAQASETSSAPASRADAASPTPQEARP